MKYKTYLQCRCLFPHQYFQHILKNYLCWTFSESDFEKSFLSSILTNQLPYVLTSGSFVFINISSTLFLQSVFLKYSKWVLCILERLNSRKQNNICKHKIIYQNDIPPCGEPQPGAIQSEELKLSKFSSSGKHIVTVKQIQKVMLDQKY